MDTTIFLFLVQDGLTNGAVYALLGLALVLVFSVTRVILIPQGEFVAYGALTLAVLDTGRVPGTATLLLVFGAGAFLIETWSYRREWRTRAYMLRGFVRSAAFYLGLPIVIWGLVNLLAPLSLGTIGKMLLTIAVIAPMGPYLYRIAFQPLAGASVLVLLIAAVGVHLSLVGLGLVFFGAEGLRSAPISGSSFALGPLLVSAHSLAVYLTTILVMVALYLFFEHTLFGKALRATAVNRLGARLVGIRTSFSGSVAFALAALIGAASGILIAPVTTVYYDTGFLIGLKGFVAAIVAGLTSFPATVAAAILVGLVEAFSSFFASNFKEIIVFTLIIPFLMWRSLSGSHIEEE